MGLIACIPASPVSKWDRSRRLIRKSQTACRDARRQCANSRHHYGNVGFSDCLNGLILWFRAVCAPHRLIQRSAVTGDQQTGFAQQHAATESPRSTRANPAPPRRALRRRSPRINRRASSRRSAKPLRLGHRDRRATWSANAGSVLGTQDLAAIATGRRYARLLDPHSTQTRFDAVDALGQRDEGEGRSLPDRVWPRCRRRTAEALDRGYRPLVCRGRRPAGARARRHPRHQRAPRATGAPRLPVALRRAHRRDEPVAPDRVLAKRWRMRSVSSSSCGFLLVAVDNLARINECYGFAMPTR